MLKYPEYCEQYQRNDLCARRHRRCENQLLAVLLITTAAAWLVAILTHFDKAATGIMAFLLLIVYSLWYHEAFK